MTDDASNSDHDQPATAHTGAGEIPGEEFIRAFTQSQRPLFAYLLPLLGNATDADEVLQETNLVIWAKWKQFEPGTNFLAWSRAIARLEVFRYRRNKSRKLVFLEDDILELVAQRSEVVNDTNEQRRAALTECVSQLREKDRQLIQMRYAAGANGDLVAKQLGRPANSVYQSLGRIRRALMECVRIRLTQAQLADGGVS